jgi:hypothetical protein
MRAALQGISAAEPLEDSGRQTASLGDQSVLFGNGLGAALAILSFGFQTTNRNAW